LELVSVSEPRCLFQLSDHGCFGFIGVGDAVDETLRELGGVEGLEDILVFNVLEEHLLRV
jgi:hypothetical protein